MRKRLEEIESKLPPKPVKSVISILDDSDSEDEVKPIKLKGNKIMKALESECDFID
jgi:hypothetical protein